MVGGAGVDISVVPCACCGCNREATEEEERGSVGLKVSVMDLLLAAGMGLNIFLSFLFFMFFCRLLLLSVFTSGGVLVNVIVSVFVDVFVDVFILFSEVSVVIEGALGGGVGGRVAL